MEDTNALQRLVAAATRLPAPLRRRVVTAGFTHRVRFAGTGRRADNRAVLQLR